MKRWCACGDCWRNRPAPRWWRGGRPIAGSGPSMRCENVLRDLDALVDGELGRWQAWRMHAHLRGCEGCRVAFDETWEITQRLREWRDVRAPARLKARIEAALAAPPEPPPAPAHPPRRGLV